MKLSIKLFIILGVFSAIVGVVYGFLTRFDELVGFPALLAVGAMSFMLAVYLWLVERNTGGILPEDKLDGEIVESAGEYGHFSPWSWWPLLLGTGTALAFTALGDSDVPSSTLLLARALLRFGLGGWRCIFAPDCAADDSAQADASSKLVANSQDSVLQVLTHTLRLVSP